MAVLYDVIWLYKMRKGAAEVSELRMGDKYLINMYLKIQKVENFFLLVAWGRILESTLKDYSMFAFK